MANDIQAIKGIAANVLRKNKVKGIVVAIDGSDIAEEFVGMEPDDAIGALQMASMRITVEESLNPIAFVYRVEHYMKIFCESHCKDLKVKVIQKPFKKRKK